MAWLSLAGRYSIRLGKYIKGKKKDRSYLLAGLIGGFTATTCCIAPIVLVILGFGTAISMVVMHKLHTISIVSGIVFMLLLSLFIVKRNRACAT